MGFPPPESPPADDRSAGLPRLIPLDAPLVTAARLTRL